MSAASAAGAPPLRFLLIVLATWMAVRAIALADWGVDPAPAGAQRFVPSPAAAQAAVATDPGPNRSPEKRAQPAAAPRNAPSPARAAMRSAHSVSALARTVIQPSDRTPPSGPMGSAARLPRADAQRPLPAPPARAQSRWSGSAWLLARDERGTTSLAPGGTLGGSQAGLRLLYRLGNGLALSGRLYAPLRRTGGAEGALGVDWRPLRAAPVHLLAERRQALGGEGRSAFALTLYGGGTIRLPLRLELDSYAQAGIVGLRSRDLFVDGAARLRRPLGPVEMGAGLWGAAQPGTARLDAGPHISYRLPVRAANLRLSADWRFRIAGDAAPGSGPALTLGADF